MTCSANCINGYCNGSLGHCVNGCVPGYHGNRCELVCPKTCSENVCQIDSGACLQGCSSGFDGPFCEYETNSGSPDSFVIGFTGCLIGLSISFILALSFRVVKRVTKRGKCYRSIGMSTTQNAAPIYEEISEFPEITEGQRYTGSHLYMEVGSISCGDNANMIGHYDVPRKQASIKSEDIHIGMRGNRLEENDHDTTLNTCMQLLRENNISEENREIQSLSSLGANKTEEFRTSSNKYITSSVNVISSEGSVKHRSNVYEVPASSNTIVSQDCQCPRENDEIVNVISSEGNIKSIYNVYEVPASSKTITVSQDCQCCRENDEIQSKRYCKSKSLELNNETTGSKLDSNIFDKNNIDTTEVEIWENKNDNTTNTLDMTEKLEIKTNASNYTNEKIELDTFERTKSDEFCRLSSNNEEHLGEDKGLTEKNTGQPPSNSSLNLSLSDADNYLHTPNTEESTIEIAQEQRDRGEFGVASAMMLSQSSENSANKTRHYDVPRKQSIIKSEDMHNMMRGNSLTEDENETTLTFDVDTVIHTPTTEDRNSDNDNESVSYLHPIIK